MLAKAGVLGPMDDGCFCKLTRTDVERAIVRICYYLGTYEDWGGASRALLNFIVRVDRARFEPLVVVTRQGNLISKLAERGIATAISPKREWNGNPLKFFADILRSITFLRRHGVDLIHLNGDSLGWKAPELIAAKVLRIPVLMHYHIVDTNVTPFIKYVAGIIAVSRYVADHSNFESRPTYVVHNLADIARFAHGKSIRDELGFNNFDIIIGFLGQIKRIKGIELFLRLAAAINKPNVKFVIAGEIKDSDPEFIARFNLEISRNPAIRYIGYRNDPENIYSSADILIMPSQWEEPCAMVLFESAAAKRPIIASRTGGTPEIIEDGVNGLLFERGDFEMLLRHTMRLIEQPADRSAFGQKAGEVVDQRFTSGPVRELERIYVETGKRPGGRMT